MPTPALLLAEDEAMILLDLEDSLEQAGFATLSAVSGGDAQRIFEQNAIGIVGLITDIRLADEVTGWDVARYARERNPSLPVVYISADSVDQWQSAGVPKSVIIQKPFTMAQVIAEVCNLINNARRSS